MKTIAPLVLLLGLAITTRAAPPTIVVQPQDQTTNAGSTVTYTVEAAGTPPLSYQWRAYLNAIAFTNIPLATQDFLALSNVQPTSVRFAVLVTNAEGAITSRIARLVVTVPPPPQLRLELLGTHPTSPLTAFPAIHALKAVGDRIYLGYGDVNLFPAVVVASFDPTRNSFHLEFSCYTDAIGAFREIAGVLYVPSTDPVLYADSRDYSYRVGGVWRDSNPFGTLHVWDMATFDGSDVWLMGSKTIDERDTRGPTVFRSIDGGGTWTDLTIQSSLAEARYYYGFALRDRFYVRDTYYTNNSDEVMVGTRIAAAPYQQLRNQTRLGEGPNEFLLTVRGYFGGIQRVPVGSLVTYDTLSWRTLRNNLYDFAMSGTNVITLESNAVNEIWMASAVTPSQATWRRLEFVNIPADPQSIEVHNGVLYLGDAQGRLWGGRLDTNAINPPAASVVNELPDEFGRALSFDGQELLAVGAPDHSGAAPLCGQVTIWERRHFPRGEWDRRETINPPAASFSGWFGKAVAVEPFWDQFNIAGGVLAVVEAGRDLSRRDRGSSAQVHIYGGRWVGDSDILRWYFHSSLNHPYAQSVAIDSGWMAVGMGGTDYGVNSLALYTVALRDTGLEVMLRTNIAVQSLPHAWRPTARVALENDICAFASVGDGGFFGGPGEVQIFQRDTAGTWRLQQTLHSHSAPPAGRAAEGPWVYSSGQGTWRADGQQVVLGSSITTRLNSPAVTVSQPGMVRLSFNHRWSFQPSFDGGQVRVSINNGPYQRVPGAAFSQNGYNGTLPFVPCVQCAASELRGQEAFAGDSPGYSTGARVTSACDLGPLNAGDTFSVQFMYGADGNTRGSVPNWEVDSVALTEAGGAALRSDDFNANDGGYIADTDTPLPMDRFGYSLDLQNGWLAVGAPRDDVVALQAGAVHLYQRTNTPAGAASFVLRQTILCPINQPETGFGNSVALRPGENAPPFLAVGSPGVQRNAQRHHGAVFIYKLDSGTWRYLAEADPVGPGVPAEPSGGEFGNAVAFDANWLAASSRFSQSSSNLEDRLTLWPIGGPAAGPAAGQLSQPLRLSSGDFSVTARGELGRTYHLQSVTDLQTRNWTDLFPFTLTRPATNLTDTAASLPQRFYRLRSEELLEQ
jgi:hypothetical protein